MIACGWYALGDANRDTPGRWEGKGALRAPCGPCAEVLPLGSRQQSLTTSPGSIRSRAHAIHGLTPRYLVSLHWSLTQFTPAGVVACPQLTVLDFEAMT